MPKIAMPTNEVRPAIDEIQDLINHIEFVLEGRVDNENIWKDSNTAVYFPSSKVNDMATSSKPIEAPKFFSNFSSLDSPFDKFQTLISNMNTEYRVLEGTAAIIINKDTGTLNNTAYIEIEKPSNYKLVTIDSFLDEQVFDYDRTAIFEAGLGNNATSLTFDEILSVYMPHTIGNVYAITYGVFVDRFESQYAGSKSIAQSSFEVDVVSVSNSKIILKVTALPIGDIKKDEFLTVSLTAYALCKELL